MKANQGNPAILAEDGYQGLTINGVAARAKVGRPAIYRAPRTRGGRPHRRRGFGRAPGGPGRPDQRHERLANDARDLRPSRLVYSAARGLGSATPSGPATVIAAAILATHVVLRFPDGYVVATVRYGRHLQPLGDQ